MDNKSVYVLAGLIFTSIVGGTAFHVYGGTKFVVGLIRPDHTAEMNKILSAQAETDRTQLPLKVNPDTTLIEETAAGTKLTYTYTLAEAAVTPIKLSEGAFKNEVTKRACASGLARQVRSGATLAYVYYTADKSQKVAEFTVTDCGGGA